MPPSVISGAAATASDFSENAERQLRRQLVLRQFILDEKLRIEAADVDRLIENRVARFDNEGLRDSMRNYYRSGRGYRPVRLGRNDRIYRGSDNRYYCRRDDGTTGLIVGAMAGGVLGNIISPGGYKTLGTILGAGGGALIGRAIDDGVECR